ncbi:hypothetical protein ACHWQZ_G018898 [Mnemiopsis leidyi]
MTVREFLLHLLLLCQIVSTSYRGDKVYRLSLSTEVDVKDILSFITETRDYLDYWQTELHVGGHVDVRLSRQQDELLSSHHLRNISHTVQIEDVQKLLNKVSHYGRGRTKRSTSDDEADYSYTRFNNPAATHREMYRLAAQYPNLTRLVGVGSTHQGRPLLVMEIGLKKERNCPMVWVDGGLHAREWITVAATMLFIKKLLEGYGTDPYITDMLDSTKFAIQPLANPDGYAYSWNSERLWRKNRSPTSVAWCKGVDLNRNFDINFGGQGASDFSCSEIYNGPNAFSEHESKGIARYLSSVRHKLLGYFSLHSYGQMWLTPLSYTRKKVTDRTEHLDVAHIATRKIKEATGQKYSYGPATALMYVTSGDSSDWVYSELNCSHTYGIELGDMGRYGFLLPPSHIRPTSNVILSGVLAAVEVIAAGPDNLTTPRRQRKYKRRKWRN